MKNKSINMNSQAITQKINAVTADISKKYPELLKYISEMPVTIPNNAEPGVTLAKLEDYYRSLTELLEHYAVTHKIEK